MPSGILSPDARLCTKLACAAPLQLQQDIVSTTAMTSESVCGLLCDLPCLMLLLQNAGGSATLL